MGVGRMETGVPIMANYNIFLVNAPITIWGQHNEKEIFMENLPNWLVILLSILGALGGGAGILSWIQFPQEKKKAMADAYETLSHTVDNLSERIDKQVDRIDELETEVSALQIENSALKRGINRLVGQIKKAGLEPVWTPDMNGDIIDKNLKE
jgi:cell division protein FtsB